jgi:hypothetical protein
MALTTSPSTAQAPEPTQAPVVFRRDDDGLIIGAHYHVINGRISWRHSINPAHVVFNGRLDEEIEARYGAKANKLVYADVIKTHVVDDRHILIKLDGFVELAELRGYTAAPVTISHVTPDGQHVSAVCHITWLPNVEEPFAKTSSGEADATFANTGGFGYLTAMAGNRAFVRAVKRGLGISILGFDEIAKKDTPLSEPSGDSASVGGTSTINPLSPQGTLQTTAQSLNLSFETVRKGAVKYATKMKATIDEINGWTSFADVPPPDCMSLIGLLRKKPEPVAA